MSNAGLVISGIDWVVGDEEPLDAQSKWTTVQDWDEAALQDPGVFTRDLTSTGARDAPLAEALTVLADGTAEIARAVATLDELDAQYRGVSFLMTPANVIEARQEYDEARTSALTRLRDWWKRRVTIVGETEVRTVRCPLFVLGAPANAGCRAEWRNEESAEWASEWSVKIAGTGFGTNSTSTSVSSSSFSADSGETKLIFLNVEVRLEEFIIREGKTDVGKGHRVLFPEHNKQSMAPGLLKLEEGAAPPRGALHKRFPLAGDTTGSMSTYSFSYENRDGASAGLGVEFRGTKLGLNVSSDFSDTLSLTYSLRGGLDYDLHYVDGFDGLVF